MGVDPVSLAINAALMAANMALTASQTIEGPRLTDLTVSTADYGTALSYAYGTRKITGTLCIWAEPLREVKSQNKTKGGKYNDYKYYGTWAQLVLDQPADAVTRIWFDEHLVYDATGAGPVSPFSVGNGSITDYMRIYLGAADQLPDPAIQARTDADLGAGSTPAYRGVTYIVFDNLPLEKLGNRLPQVAVEVVTNGGPAFPIDSRDRATTTGGSNLLGFAYSPDRSRVLFSEAGEYEIWDVTARALMISGDLDQSLGDLNTGDQASLTVTNDGTIYAAGVGGLFRYNPDGTGAQTLVGTWASAGEATALQTADGVEWVGVASSSLVNDGALYDIGAGLFTVLDTAALTGAAWQIKFFFTDLDGVAWAIGASEVSSTLAMWQVAPLPGAFYFIPMPSAQASFVTHCAAYHYRDDAVDHFVIAWSNDYLVTVDASTFTVTQTRAYGLSGHNTEWAFRSVGSNPSGVWISDDEISSVDLSTLRSVDLTDWGLSFSAANSSVYDPINHALIVGTAVDEFAWVYLDRAAGQGVTLQSIVEDVATRAGLSADDFDASDLTQAVDGYSWTQGTGKAILEPLLEAFDSEARPHDFRLDFRRRGAASLGTIPVAQMGAGGGKRYTVTRTLDSDLPLGVDVTHADPAMDQQPNTQHAQRNALSVDSSRAQSLDLTTLLLTVDDAKAKAEGYLRRIWFGAETYDNALTRAWSKLEPGDVWTLDLDGELKSAALQKLEFGANGVLTLNWKRDVAKIHDATSLSGAGADGYIPPTILAVGYSKALVLDVPIIRDADDGIIAYVVGGPYSAAVVSWLGAAVLESTDGTDYSTTFATLGPSDQGTLGYTASALGDASAAVWDRASSVTVAMQAGSLTSTTEAAVEGGANLALIGDELVGFTTATLTAPDTYELSGLLRGRRGTEQFTTSHVSGERFVLMTGNVIRAALGASDVGDTLYFKPVTTGSLIETGFPQSLVYQAASAKPYSPVHLRAADVAGDTVISWTRRTRIGGEALNGTTPPLGETTEAYEVDILNGANSAIRTLSGLTSATATYTAAMIAADSAAGVTAKVYQISSTVGRGFPGTVTL